ncbi:MAG: tRNA pseudouridine(13) synthase TruD [Planctomycetes bacterium]|nr:tRNA pseudouridine(13) synthase TruD [Planctomycetota bacterium]
MRLKTKPGDFRVRELLDEAYIAEHGPHRVYLVQKRKLTSLEAAEALATLADVPTADVGMAGLKDRQGVTTQYMSVPGGRRVELDKPELKIRLVGGAREALTAEHSRGNAFELRLRDLTAHELELLERNRAIVAKLGVPNYFGEQRFGNLRHAQGWVARELMLGHDERALKDLLCAESPHDAGQLGRFKAALREAWGDWAACREIAGRFGEHHSVFEHLRKEPDDFRGAFYHVSSRLRLIHLYAFQSHVWNRALAWFLARVSGEKGARVAASIEGPLVFPERFLEEVAEWKSVLRLPGDGLADVEVPAQRALFAEVLADEGLDADRFRIEGVSGFQLKGEDRRMFVKPEHLRVQREGRAGREDRVLSFELPRGAYATLVVQALLAEPRRGPLDLRALARAGTGRDGAQGRGDARARRARRPHGRPPRQGRRRDLDQSGREAPRRRARRARRARDLSAGSGATRAVRPPTPGSAWERAARRRARRPDGDGSGA